MSDLERMPGVVVTYRTRGGESERNSQLVAEVFDQLAAEDPGGVRYAAFRLADDRTFHHVALFDDPASNPLSDLSAFAAFQHLLSSRCDQQPNPSEAGLVGSYRMF